MSQFHQTLLDGLEGGEPGSYSEPRQQVEEAEVTGVELHASRPHPHAWCAMKRATFDPRSYINAEVSDENNSVSW